MRGGSSRAASALVAATLSVLLGGLTAHAATFTILSKDGAGEGFNDPSPRAPVGGNAGTTLGQQRLNAFQYAANLWGATLQSDVAIRVASKFDPLTCSSYSAMLGQAGPTTALKDFPGAPIANTWYAVALANSIVGSDQLTGYDDINATFNSSIDTGCFLGAPNGWYYGFDGHPGSGQIDLIPTLLHELGHGLGFLTFVDLGTGAKMSGFNDVFMLYLEDHSTGMLYPNMTDAQRLAASTDTGNLHWVGPNVEAASGMLTAGRVGNHVEMYAPATQQPGSSVSHFDTSLTPNELMEPYATANPQRVLATQLLKDVGWTLIGAVTPTPTSTPTTTPTVTLTSTPSRTPTLTSTSTRTSTPTATFTATLAPTATATGTRTPTVSPTNTATTTSTQTPSVTATSTKTATSTPTATASASPTQTPTVTNTATRTVTPTATSTSSATATRTGSPTASSTATATATPVPAIDLGTGVGRPGGIACVSSTLTTGGAQIAATSNLIGFDATRFSLSDCAINPTLAVAPYYKQMTDSPGAGSDDVQIGGTPMADPDGLLFTARFAIAPTTALGLYAVTNAPGAWDPAGDPISPLVGAAGQIIVTSCTGDCDGDGHVTIGEVVKCTNMFLGQPLCSPTNPSLHCPVADADLSGSVSIGEVVQCANHFLSGCP